MNRRTLLKRMLVLPIGAAVLAACIGPAQSPDHGAISSGASGAAGTTGAAGAGTAGATTPAVDPQNLQTATLAGGCFWSMQRMLDAVPGVITTTVASLGFAPPAP